MSHQITCPICDSQSLEEISFTETFNVDGGVVKVEGLEATLCANCGSDPVLETQVRSNQVKIADAVRSCRGLLTTKEVRRLRSDFGLTQQNASILFGGGTNAFSKYERGEVSQSIAMDRLMRLVQHLPGAMEALAGIAKMNVVDVKDAHTPIASKNKAQYSEVLFEDERTIDAGSHSKKPRLRLVSPVDEFSGELVEDTGTPYAA
jgi:HTH-type transcriptional regulator / antitoxin MqsA